MAITKRKFLLRYDVENPRNAIVELNGESIVNDITGVKFDVDLNGINYFEIRFLATEVDIELIGVEA